MAERGRNGRWRATAPAKAPPPGELLPGLRSRATGGLFLGFDFPIGVPRAYAARARITNFTAALARFGSGGWERFYDVAGIADEIGLRRPFFPMRPGGGVRRESLFGALGLGGMRALMRLCDLATEERRAACPVFWTLGPNQVGKAAIVGWRDLLAPALQSLGPEILLWPFAGDLGALLRGGRIVVAETYPTECYGHLGIRFARRRPGIRSGKTVAAERAAQAPALMAWAKEAEVLLAPELRRSIVDGFEEGGDDAFDSVVGLFGMLNVILGRRQAGAPRGPAVRRVEGWNLGQLAPRG